MLRQRNNFTVGMTFLNLSLFSFLLLALTSTGDVDAAQASKRRETLLAESTNIIVGRVKSIMKTEANKTKDFSTANGVVEIEVTSVEKGETIKIADSVYARFSKTAWVGEGSPIPYGSGHNLPKKDQTVRVYLIQRNAGYDAICPNGFEVIKPTPVAE